jgi:chromosome partitioning protein
MHEFDVLVFASQKGGSGKTTMSGHMAVAAARAGLGPIAVVDTDPQGSLLAWAKARVSHAADLQVVKSTGEYLAEDLMRLREAGVRMVFIDTPPAANASIVEAVRQADLVVVPTRPSPHDLRAVGSTIDIVEAHRKTMVFVVNSATPRAKITADAAVALSQHGTVAPVTVHHRVDYASSMIDGRSVLELDPDGRSAGEMTALWSYLAGRLAKHREQFAAELANRRGLVPEAGAALRRAAPVFGRREAGAAL